MPENKDLSQESFLLVRFEKPHSTSLIDFKNNNVDSLTTAGKKFSLNVKMRASIPLDKQEKGFAWLIANGYAPLIKEAVNSQSLSSAINGYFEAEAKLPPDDAIRIYNQESISIRKA